MATSREEEVMTSKKVWFITGASRVEQIGENMKAIDAVEKMTGSVMAEIEAILDNAPKIEEY